jgi:hypothetical protein
MATTLLTSFKEFASNLNVTDRQEKVVSTCRENVVDAIKKEITLHSDQSSKLIGSYDRDTLIRYLSENDVDVMVILHYGKNKDWETPEGTVTVLNKFKSILSTAYPKTNMRIDRNCVTMKLSEFTLDVVPAFRYENGSYTIPDTYQKKWLSTNPVEFSKKISEVNKTMDSTFIPLIKMVKGWNRENGFIIRSFHLECMLYDHYKSYLQAYSYDSTLQVFFSKLPYYLRSSCYDPVTFDRLDEYLDNNAQVTDRDKAIEKAKKAAEISKKARDYSENYPDHPEYSINEWKKLLGEFFPLYG